MDPTQKGLGYSNHLKAISRNGGEAFYSLSKTVPYSELNHFGFALLSVMFLQGICKK